MGIITKPYTFASGNVVDGTQINADFDALITGVGDTATLRPTLVSLGAVAGPASATDHAIARFDAWTGKLVQDSSVIILDDGALGVGTVPVTMLDVKAASGIHLGVRTGEADATAIQLNAYNDAAAANISMELKATKFNFNVGNVGIGTVAPLSKLAINGGLHVGGDSDAGNDNLLVDGSATIGGQAAVVTNDARLSDARLASDVYAWAKAATKPAYIAAEVGTAAYSEGTWTPVLHNFTIVGEAPPVSGTYRRIGNLVFVTCVISAGWGGNTSVEGIASVSYATGMLATPAFNTPCYAAGFEANSLGVGLLTTSGNLVPAPFAAQGERIFISATYSA